MKRISTLFTLLLVVLASVHAQTNDYPFELTKEGEAPKLYYILSGRDGNGGKSDYAFTNVIPWGTETPALCLNRQDPRLPLNQFWYFMEAEDGNIMIISAEDGRMVTVPHTNNAAKCTEMQSKAELTNKFYTWIFNETNGCYAFQTSDKKNFLSHNGGWQTAGQVMGLWNADGSKDEGTRVFFEPAPEGVSTGIKAVKVNANETTKAIYTLAGQKQNNVVRPGIYVVNGKKTIVK